MRCVCNVTPSDRPCPECDPEGARQTALERITALGGGAAVHGRWVAVFFPDCAFVRAGTRQEQTNFLHDLAWSH